MDTKNEREPREPVLANLPVLVFVLGLKLNEKLFWGISLRRIRLLLSFMSMSTPERSQPACCAPALSQVNSVAHCSLAFGARASNSPGWPSEQLTHPRLTSAARAAACKFARRRGDLEMVPFKELQARCCTSVQLWGRDSFTSRTCLMLHGVKSQP